MKKIEVLFVFLAVILLTGFLTTAQTNDVGTQALNKVKDVAKDISVNAPSGINNYAEIAGVNLLKFQNFLMGTLSFISLGAFQQGGTTAFAQFLFMIILFIIFYGTIGFFSKKFNFLIASILTIISFSTIDVNEVRAILYNYEAMGITITVVLPILILFAFTLGIYKRAYEGKSSQSPFYAELFNLIFLIFFGVFFIRYSNSEEGVTAIMRYASGWILIALGISQTLLYKIIIQIFHNMKSEEISERKKRKKEKLEALDKLKEEEADEMFKNKK